MNKLNVFLFLGVGGAVGSNMLNGRISDVHINAYVSGIVPTGGLVGINNGNVQTSFATGSVSGGAGLVGQNQGTGEVHSNVALNNSAAIARIVGTGASQITLLTTTPTKTC